MPRSYLRNWLGNPQFQRQLTPVGEMDVILWWESRRFFYNCVVGVAGVTTCAHLIICAFMADSMVGEPIGLPDGPLLGVFGIVVYAFLANIFYTGGWISELLLRSGMTAEKASAFGRRAFSIGVNFSILLTLCPAAFCWLAFAVALARGQKHGPLGE
jgi:hypothetical protein